MRPLPATVWHGKGVGRMKLQREEPTASSVLRGGTMTLELSAWQ
jgi:hypothetical protein